MKKTEPEHEEESVPAAAAPAKRRLAPERLASVEAQPQHSRAFENLVHGPDDIVGLLAYAKFKESVREAAVSGNHMDRGARQVTPAMVDVFRSAAEQMITQVVDEGLQAAAPDIEKSALKTAMEAQFAETVAAIKTERSAVTAHIDRRTSFWNSFFTNLAAWVVTLLVAVAIIYLFNRPSVEESILGTNKPPPAVTDRSPK